MPLRVVVASRAPGPLEALTVARPRLTIEAYPAGRLLLLRARGDVRGLDAPEAWSTNRRLLHAGLRGEEATVLIEGAGDDAPIAALAEAGAHLLPPIRWRRGEARVTLEVPDGTDLDRIRALFPAGRLVASRRAEAGALLSPLLLPGLTAKQARALLAAHEAGYYRFPRDATTAEVAAGLAIARSTFEQHLNRAESQVIGSLLPVVRLRARDGPPPGDVRRERAEDADAVETFSRFSREIGLFVVMEIAGERVRRVRLDAADPGAAGRRRGHPTLDRVVRHLRTGTEDLADVPVDLDARGFDRAVLDLLRTIPAGETLTYGEVARRLGKPGAARAVGNACAKNPILVVIPCHRVVPSGGGVGQYAGAGGAATKRALLEREGAFAPEGA